MDKNTAVTFKKVAEQLLTQGSTVYTARNLLKLPNGFLANALQLDEESVADARTVLSLIVDAPLPHLTIQAIATIDLEDDEMLKILAAEVEDGHFKQSY